VKIVILEKCGFGKEWCCNSKWQRTK